MTFALACCCASRLAAQEPCASDGGDACDERRWRVEPTPLEPSPPPSAASEAGPSQPWSMMLERTPPAPAKRTVERWYGWQTLIGDGLAIASVLMLEPITIALGCGIGLLVPPIIHFAHQNGLSGSISFGMRAFSGGLVLLGFFVASEDVLGLERDEETVGAVLAIGGLVGFAASLIIDASVLSFDQVPDEWYGVVPWIDPKRGIGGVRFALTL